MEPCASRECIVRSAGRGDLEAIARIQARCPEASQWPVEEYLALDCRVAESCGAVRGYSVARPVAADESELLNLAVDPEWRHKGVGRRLVRDLSERHPGSVYLEVRESNQGARVFYQTLGFQMFGRREGYYDNPPEAAVVMKFSFMLLSQ